MSGTFPGQTQGGSMSVPVRPYDYVFKLLLVGDSSVGKTCLLLRFCDNTFLTTFISTIGIDFKIKTITLDDKSVKLQIWDTAGQERFRTITTAYYRGAMGVILVYDITNVASFHSVRNWLKVVEENSAPDVVKVVVGNKCDMTNKRQVSREQGEALAKEFNLMFFEASAKSGEIVESVFMDCARVIKDKMDRKAQSTEGAARRVHGTVPANQAGQVVSVTEEPKKDGKPDCAC